jgi:hypothetical protein
VWVLAVEAGDEDAEPDVGGELAGVGLGGVVGGDQLRGADREVGGFGRVTGEEQERGEGDRDNKAGPVGGGGRVE